jgi:uncharacterized protein (TIGR02453 family)
VGISRFNEKCLIMETIKKSTLDFLTDLKCNNDREWFNNNRARYNDARSNYETFVQAIIDRITQFDPILKGLEVKSCTYRINRDIRFSNDKSIYKTYMGAFIVRGGKKNGDRFAGYYVHVEPGNNMIAGGAYMPPKEWLSEIRGKIDEDGDKFQKIINNKDLIRIFGSLEGEKLKTAPKGYPKDHPYIELLKFKSFLVAKSLSDREIMSDKALDTIVEASKVMKPMNDFLNDY